VDSTFRFSFEDTCEAPVFGNFCSNVKTVGGAVEAEEEPEIRFDVVSGLFVRSDEMSAEEDDVCFCFEEACEAPGFGDFFSYEKTVWRAVEEELEGGFDAVSVLFVRSDWISGVLDLGDLYTNVVVSGEVGTSLFSLFCVIRDENFGLGGLGG